jgi:hypothetical protein
MFWYTLSVIYTTTITILFIGTLSAYYELKKKLEEYEDVKK